MVQKKVIMGGSHEHNPSKVRLFKNRPHMTFDDAQSKSDQVCSVYLLNLRVLEVREVREVLDSD